MFILTEFDGYSYFVARQKTSDIASSDEVNQSVYAKEVILTDSLQVLNIPKISV